MTQASSTDTAKLDAGQRHFLRLIVNGADSNGWAPVSAVVYPLLAKMPAELVEHELVGDEGRGRARLTEQGESVIYAEQWI